MKNPTLKKSIVIAKSSGRFVFEFFRWILIAIIIGCIGGLIGSLFSISIKLANNIRGDYPLLILLMPLGGISIVGIYKLCKLFDNRGTDDIIDSVRTDGSLPLRTVPLIFVSTVITHLTGGSSGREGAALQIGGSIGYQVGRLFKLDEKDRHLLVMCGMSALFSALFGTPLTSTVFAIEVISVGVMYYSGLIPCMTSALVAFGITRIFNIAPIHFDIVGIPSLNINSVVLTAVIAGLCAGLSVIFCISLHSTAHILQKKFKNPYIRIIVGSLILIAMTYLVGSYDYNGAGTEVIHRAINGKVRPEAFALKIIFTAVTIGAGFKGGEIVPTFFIGATFGAFISGLIGLGSSYGAAVGMIAMFCGMLNCPMASIMLSMEIFGEHGIVLFAVTAAVSYMLSGDYGLYHSQRIVYSKLRAEYVNKITK